jgi:HK97 gp10 family phage protein
MPVVFRNSIPAIIAGLPAAIDGAMEDTANDIGSLAQDLAPEKTGDLKRSKKVEKRGAFWTVIFAIFYAVFVEYGTDKSEAQPFLTPAVRNISLTFRLKERLNTLFAKNKV